MENSSSYSRPSAFLCQGITPPSGMEYQQMQPPSTFTSHKTAEGHCNGTPNGVRKEATPTLYRKHCDTKGEGGRAEKNRALELRCPISTCHTFTECLIHRAPPTAPKSSEMLAVHHRLMKEPSVLSSDGWNDLVWLGFINTEGARRTFHRLRAEQGNRRECKRQR